jgi:hypothetical protein
LRGDVRGNRAVFLLFDPYDFDSETVPAQRLAVVRLP